MPIAWALMNWRWLLPAAGLALALGWGGIQTARLNSLKAAVAEERAAAAVLQTASLERARAQDNANAELATKLDAEHAKAVADIDASRADFNERLRRARSARANCVPATAGDPGQPQNVAPGGDGGRGSDDPASRLRDIALRLQADVRECVGWAAKVGR